MSSLSSRTRAVLIAGLFLTAGVFIGNGTHDTATSDPGVARQDASVVPTIRQTDPTGQRWACTHPQDRPTVLICTAE